MLVKTIAEWTVCRGDSARSAAPIRFFFENVFLGEGKRGRCCWSLWANARHLATLWVMGCAGSKIEVDYADLHFEEAEPNEREREIAGEVAGLLGRTRGMLERLATYRGCAEPIKVAVRTPSLENDVAAWQAVVPAVRMLQDFFDFYGEFRDALLKLLAFVCADDPLISLPENLHSARLLVQMLDFVIRFDELKMGKATIQNDFSFYRRSMSRMKRGEALGELDVEAPPVNDETANRMSLFFAYPNPFTKALIDEFARLDAERTARCFGLLANACRALAEREPDGAEGKERAFGLFRAMVAAILFYDYLLPQGVFVKKSDVDVVACVGALKRYHEDAMDLLNTIRYGTHSFNSETTPKRVLDAMQ